MISLKDIAQNIKEAEVDDDKIIKYKKKDGEQGEMKAGSAKTMEKDHPAKIAYDKMKGDDDSGEEPKGKDLGKGDFSRDGDDDAPKGEPEGEPSGEEPSVEDMSDEELGDATQQAQDEYDIARPKADDVEMRTGNMDSDEHKEAEAAYTKVIAFEKEIRKRRSGKDEPSGEPEEKPSGEPEVDGPSPEDDDWNSESVMTAKLDDEEVGDIIGDEDHPNYKKALRYIMSFDPDDEKLISGPGGDHGGWKPKDETVTINGQKYRPIKESKESNPRMLKEIYDRTFRSLK